MLEINTCSAREGFGGGRAQDTSPYGSRIGTGAASIDIVVKDIPIGREFTEAEVVQLVRRRNLPERGAVRRHLDTLRDRGHIRRSDNGWQRLN